MTQHPCLRLPSTLIAVAAVWILTTPAPAGAGIDTAAAAAAKASPELVGALSKEIGATSEQAAGAAGSLLGPREIAPHSRRLLEDCEGRARDGLAAQGRAVGSRCWR